MHLEPWLLVNGCCRQCAGYPFPETQPLKAMTMLYAALSAGFFEETIFRGHAMVLLKRRFKSNAAAAILSSVAFALIHWCQGSGKLISTFLVGAIPAIYVARTKNLWPPILFHIVLDLLAW